MRNKMNKTIIIAGVTGFIGEALARFFLANGFIIKGLTRGEKHIKALIAKGIEPVRWDGFSPGGWEDHLEHAYAVINLAGESIASGRWTQPRKNNILNSRVNVGKILTAALGRVKNKPKVYIQASAIGYYGARGDDELGEEAPPGRGFLADVVQQWETSSLDIETTGIRRVVCRLGMVLGRDGGSLPRLVLPFRFFVGGPLGSGRQWVSWIHIDDAVKGIDFLISHETRAGVFNFTAPNPVRNRELARILGNILHRPSFFPVPSVVLKILLGEMAGELILTGQRVLPLRLMHEGFEFLYPHAPEALENLLR